MRRLSVALLLLLAAFARATERDVTLCRISVENETTHFQALAARRFADILAERTGGSLRVEFYDGARLFRDADAVNALTRGQVEIIFPGIWQLDKFVPDFAALMLPTVYARPVGMMRELVDGAFGTVLSAKVEVALSAKALGPWLDAGYAHLFTVSPMIRSAPDIAGKRIRVAGGKGNMERIRSLGAEAVVIPLLDLRAYLSDRLVDGVLSTYEAVDSSRLDRNGIRAVFEDEEYYPFYVPLVSGRFWESLDDDARRIAMAAWAEVVGTAREESVRAHAEAKARLEARGLVVFRPTRTERELVRASLQGLEGDMARRLNVPGDTARLLADFFRGPDASAYE